MVNQLVGKYITGNVRYYTGFEKETAKIRFPNPSDHI